MVKNYFYLRPSEDISVGHNLTPSDSTSAYILINEEVSDGDTTCLSVASSNGVTASATSSFKLSGNTPACNFFITSAKVYFSYTLSVLGVSNASISLTVNVNNSPINVELNVSIDSSKEYILDEEFIDLINTYIKSNGAGSFPNIDISLTTSITSDSNKSNVTFNLSQIYIELFYNIGVHRKVLNKWNTAIASYKKIDGVWTQINNCYDKMQSNLIKSGHHQEYLPAVASTCTETGLTEGYKCAVCGEIIRPQEIIPANGHNYVSSGGYQVCSVCQHVYGIGFVELIYHGTATALSQARYALASTTVGNYALFGGGTSGGNMHSTVDAYDTSLTRTTPTALSETRHRLAATTVGNYALFGGGVDRSNIHSTVDAYDTSLTRTTPTALSEARYDLASTTVGNYALFGGGTSDSNIHSTVDAYDTSLTRTTPTALSETRHRLAATTVGNYALFGGGESGNGSGTYSSVVDAYDTSLTRTIPTALSEARSSLESTTVGNYALFGGGTSGSGITYSSVVDAYDTSLTRTTPTALSEARSILAATTVVNHALFGGGTADSSGTYSSVVDAYDTSLTRTIPTALSKARRYLESTTVGNYALFGGGTSGSGITYSSVVDVYKIQPIL